MKPETLWKERFRFLLLGILLAIGFVLLTGGMDSTPPPNYGRYQLSAWAGPLGPQGGAVGAFVIDTASGETRTVYSRVYGNPGEGSIIKHNLNRPFSAMQ
jgi:hypothetical protein